jgi:hypothetical protein
MVSKKNEISQRAATDKVWIKIQNIPLTYGRVPHIICLKLIGTRFYDFG